MWKHNYLVNRVGRHGEEMVQYPNESEGTQGCTMQGLLTRMDRARGLVGQRL
jgi:hypothetical protein